MIQLFIPFQNEMPKSVNKIFKNIYQDVDKIIEEIYCDQCLSKLDQSKKCQNNDCLNYEIISTKKNRFSFISFKPKITTLIQHYGKQIIEYQNSSRNYMDLIDGIHYKSLKERNYLTLMAYTDGIQLSKSNGNCFYPVIIGICELPQTIRDSIKNKIVFGVWYGSKKPSSDILFEKLIEELNSINQDGIAIRLEDKEVTLKLKLYGVLSDTPAKATVLNMNNFNGNFGCPYCLNPGNEIFLN